MQCQSYFPVYHSHYDLNVDANGGATPMYNSNGTFRSGHYNDYVSPPPIPRGPFPYKELLRQTMLMHEVTFKDQVQELHRLYRRQKELMGEFKSIRLDVQSSDSSSTKISDRYGQNNVPSLPFMNSYCPPYSTIIDNIQTSLSSVKQPKPSPGPVASQNGHSLNNLQSGEPKGRKIKGILLDLELPAEVYIDSDEEEHLENVEFSKAPTPPSKRSKVVVETIVSASHANGSLDPVLLREPPTSCSFSGTKTNLADLNEPLTTSYVEGIVEDKRTKPCLEISDKNHEESNNGNTIIDGCDDKLTTKSLAHSGKAKSEVGSASCGTKAFYNSGKNPLVVQGLPSINSQLLSSKGAKNYGRQRGLINNKVDAGPNLNVAKSSARSCSESKLKESVDCIASKTRDLNCFDLNSAVVANSEFTPSGDILSCKIYTEVETGRKSKICRMIDINIPFDLTTDEEPVTQDDLVGHDNEKLCGSLNFNFVVNNDELPPKSSFLDKAPLEVDLEAPISPEVEERPPPRGDSEEIESEEGRNHVEELAKLAAEAILSISLSNCVSYPDSTDLQRCEASDCGNLERFAELVCSFSVDIENDFRTMKCNDTCNIDEFEAMTLELTEMKMEDHWCRNDVQISSETCPMLLPCQTRKGRTRRSKRKDFQKEVLPSLATLSRYEVTEDIQMIEGLMEAAGTPWNLIRTRRACRMGRKPRMPKQQTFDDEVPALRTLISWDNVNRRPRGRRRPVSPTVLSKWLECAT